MTTRTARRRVSLPRCERLETRELLTYGITVLPAAPLLGDAGVTLPDLTLATFTVTDPTTPPGEDRRALVNWGDGKLSKQLAPEAGAGGEFRIHGGHFYAAPGDYAITVTVAVPGLPESKNSVVVPIHIAGEAPPEPSPAPTPPTPPAPAPVVPPVIGAQARSISARPGRTFQAVLASFGSSLPGTSPTTFRAKIAWGDGGMTSGKILRGQAGPYLVSGRHLYRKSGSYTVTITIADNVGNSAVVQTTASLRPRRATSS